MTRNHLLLAATLLLYSAFATTAHAQCAFDAGFSDNDGESMSFGDVVVDPALPLGSVLGTRIASRSLADRLNFYRCSFSTPTDSRTRWSAEGFSAITYNGEELFGVGVPGVAMRIITRGYNGLYTGAMPRTALNNGCVGDGRNYSFCGGGWGGLELELVKVGEISDGTIATPGSVRASIFNRVYVYSHALLSSSVNVVAPTCNFVVNGGDDVNLGRHNANIFTAIGSTSPWVEFPIRSTGCTVTTNQVHMTYAGTADTNNAVLFEASGLDGVGVELQRLPGGVAISPNSAARQSWTGITAAQDHLHRARFVQTQPDVSEGSGRAAITVNVTYN